MSDLPDNVDLQWIGNRLLAMQQEMRSFRDDMTILTAIALRLENSVNSLTAQVGTMVAQHRRFDARLRALEDERQ